MFTKREREMYDMCDEAYHTCAEVLDTPDFESRAVDGNYYLNRLTLRCVRGDLDAYDEYCEFYGSVLGACNNL